MTIFFLIFIHSSLLFYFIHSFLFFISSIPSCFHISSHPSHFFDSSIPLYHFVHASSTFSNFILIQQYKYKTISKTNKSQQPTNWLFLYIGDDNLTHSTNHPHEAESGCENKAPLIVTNYYCRLFGTLPHITTRSYSISDMNYSTGFLFSHRILRYSATTDTRSCSIITRGGCVAERRNFD